MSKQLQTVFIPDMSANREYYLLAGEGEGCALSRQYAYLYTPEEHARVVSIITMLENAIGQPDEVVKAIEKVNVLESGDGRKGGQECGIPRGITLTNDELGVRFYVNIKRSQHDNKQIAEHLIRMAIQYLK